MFQILFHPSRQPELLSTGLAVSMLDPHLLL